ncbi:MAG TPA: tetratricopeptide repeat protein [Rhodopila sp.]|nr:tetratricopeptide repeat protein [Rhodopila sp.]
MSRRPLGNDDLAGNMRRVALGVVAGYCGLCGIALAQAPAGQPAPTDRLLNALKTAPDTQTAVQLEARLQHVWLQAGSPAVTLLINRGVRLLETGETGGAIQSFTDAITLQPDMAEAWHQRAIARYHAGDLHGAIQDLEETVRLQPRDFAAFRTLADIAAAQEDWKGAYAAWQKLLEIDPKTPNGDDRLRELKRKALGEDT